MEKSFFVERARLFEKSQIRKDNDNRPSTAMNFEISVDIGSVYRQASTLPSLSRDTEQFLRPRTEKCSEIWFF